MYFSMKGPGIGCTRGLKSLKFPVGRPLRAKTFRTKHVNHFRDIYAKSAYFAFTTKTPKVVVNHFFANSVGGQFP